MNLLLLEPDEVTPSGVVTLRDWRARHLLDVLRVVPGQTVRVGIVNGPLGTARVDHVTSDAATLMCMFDAHAPSAPAVDLLLALPRPKVMRRLWAQLAAVGAGRIMLTNAERVERNYFDTHVLRPEVYRPLLIEGLQQARDTRLPEVSVHRRFRVLVEDELPAPATACQRAVADPSVTSRVADVVRHEVSSRALLAVGPEGGWSAFELGLLRAHGFEAIGLGPRTLRTDTACIALLTLVHDALDRCGTDYGARL